VYQANATRIRAFPEALDAGQKPAHSTAGVDSNHVLTQKQIGRMSPIAGVRPAIAINHILLRAPQIDLAPDPVMA